MSADKFYVHGAKAISHGDYQSEVVTLDVEHDSAAFENTGCSEVQFYVGRRFPGCISYLVNPGQQGLFCARVSLPKLLQLIDGDDSHGMILVPTWD
ncbi:hypothetical protein D3C79_1005780 [compost metagenome]